LKTSKKSDPNPYNKKSRVPSIDLAANPLTIIDGLLPSPKLKQSGKGKKSNHLRVQSEMNNHLMSKDAIANYIDFSEPF
jgi:hypothetical protein